MKKKTLIFIFALIFLARVGNSQLAIGQYEDEAPFRSWNIFGIYSARASSMGESIFGLTDIPFSLFENSNRKFLISANFSYNNAEFFKYSFVNTGVVISSENLKASFMGIESLRSSLRVKNWIFNLSISEPETYFRPSVEVDYTYQGVTYERIKGDFKGYLKNISFSIWKKLHKLITVGVGVHYVYGEIKREIEDDYSYYQVLTTDYRVQKLEGYYFSLSLFGELQKNLKFIAFLHTPYKRNSKSESELRYYSKNTQVEIKIKGSGKDEIKIPIKVGAGILYKLDESLSFTSNVIFFNWKNYEFEYFDEERKRDFKNIFKFGAGVEYLTTLKIKENLVFKIPFRVGYIYDPQPMRNPDSYYNYFTAGSGIYFKNYSLDIGFMFGKEKGSGNSLHASKIICTLSFNL